MFLYIRMAITMAVSLYTSRIILNTLGVEDFGIYNLVGGIVVLFSFFNNAMSASTQRFLNYEMAKNSVEAVRRVFSVSMNAHILIAGVIILLAETVGLWFLNYKLNIPTERMYAANIVYQFSILSFTVNILKVPYNASIIAYEKMSFYAWISIIEVVLKLIIVFILVLFSFDKLILFSILTFGVSVLIFIAYRIFSRRLFESCRYQLIHDKVIFKELIGFSGWSMMGSMSVIGSNQGVNMILNIFLGVAINATMGIANQVNSAIYGFISNFQLAFQPQVIKTYASDKLDKHRQLVFQASKFSFYLLLILVVPVFLNTDYILTLWLKILPEYAVEFTQLILVISLIDALSGPFWMSANAVGNIRNYQIGLSMINLLNLPFAYLVLHFGYTPYIVLVVRIALSIIAFIYRFIYSHRRVIFKMSDIKRYIQSVLVVSIFVIGFVLLFRRYNFYGENISLVVKSILSIEILVILLIGVFGLSKNELRVIQHRIFKKRL